MSRRGYAQRNASGFGYEDQIVANRPWQKLNRFQANGVAFMVVGVAFTVGTMILTSFHPLDPNRRAGLLGGSEGFIVVGVVLFFIGKKRRERKQK